MSARTDLLVGRAVSSSDDTSGPPSLVSGTLVSSWLGSLASDSEDDSSMPSLVEGGTARRRRWRFAAAGAAALRGLWRGARRTLLWEKDTTTSGLASAARAANAADRLGGAVDIPTVVVV